MKRRAQGWLGSRWSASAVLAGVLCVALAGCPNPGRKVDIGGFSLNVYELGEGDVTVIFENGLSVSLDTWKDVQPEIAQIARTVSYDRAGNGHSDRGPDPRVGSRVVAELHAMLEAAEIPPPYILVGHSFGGVFIRQFATAYPDEVVGMVAVDPDTESIDKRIAFELSAEATAIWYTAEVLDPDFLGGIGARGEFFNKENTFDEVRANIEIPAVPLIVLNAVDYVLDPRDPDSPDQEKLTAIKQEVHEFVASLSPLGVFQSVENTGHGIQNDRPDVVIDAIIDVMEQAGFDVE